jgi:ketosteroid isomerase-like protein
MGGQAGGETARDDAAEAKKAVFRRLVDAYAAGDLDALDRLMAPGYVGHPASGDRDLDGFKASIRHFHELFVYAPDSFTIEDQLVDGDKVATRMTARVRVRATGEPVTMMGINIAVITEGRLVEEWNSWEMLGAPGPQPDAAQG